MSFFKFKNFSLKNEDSAFKINTDGVLLAVWLSFSEFEKVLDIGTGTGVIPLILKYRYPHLEITAVEIDELSAKEASYNFRLNRFEDIKIVCEDIRSFCNANNVTYDHIVSNPPFYNNSSLPKSKKLSSAKHNLTFNIKDLEIVIGNLLKSDGRFSIIYPYDFCNELEALLIKSNWMVEKELIVISRKGKSAIRKILTFKKHYTQDRKTETLTLYTDDIRTKTMEYERLVSDLYL